MKKLLYAILLSGIIFPAFSQTTPKQIDACKGFAKGQNSYSVSIPCPNFPSTAYSMGKISVTYTLTNTGASTLKVNSQGSVAIIKNGSALVAGDIVANVPYLMIFDSLSGKWSLGAGGGGSGTVTDITVNAGAGVSITGSPITSSGTITVTNTAPNQTVTLTGAGSTTVIGTYPTYTVTSADVGWGLAGNSGTTAGTNFLGTTDAQDVVFKRNSVELGRFNSTDGFRATSTGTTSATYAQRNYSSSGLELFNVRSDGAFLGGQLTSENLSFGNGATVVNNDPSNIYGNTVFGVNAGGAPSGTAHHNAFFGADAGRINSGGYHNSAFGGDALFSNISGIRNTAIGSEALYANTGSDNTALGYNVMYNNVGGVSNVGAGNDALRDNINGNYNTAIGGGGVLQKSKNDQNTGVGFQALANEASGTGNTAIGYQALNTSNGNNYNTGVGNLCLQNDAGGTFNSALGAFALQNTAGGSFNTATGKGAGLTNTSGDNNTYVGYTADAGANNLSNVTALGNGAVASASNRMAMGNSSITGMEVNSNWGLHTISTPTTSATVALIVNKYKAINPAGTIAALTINFPNSPVDGNFVEVKFEQIVTTVTYVAGTGGATINGQVNGIVGGYEKWVYDVATNTWY